MSIPLDRFYLYIDGVLKQITNDIIIYRFFPHGSKKLDDLVPLYHDNRSWFEQQITANLICHDQEPLYYDLYTEEMLLDFVKFSRKYHTRGEYLTNKVASLHLRSAVESPLSCYDYTLLLHSEKNSSEVKKYQDNNFIDVYWWSHAIIARDWFRYAEHITQSKQIEKRFLIYNRAWAGTREYRLKFADFLVRLGLDKDCKMSINPVEPELGIHYEIHKFKNPVWRPTNVLENFFPISTAHSHYSADFDIKDYESTDIEVVLETLFDDSRLHLTEKSLRPIACGQPFILAGTCGSLEYLRSYGFKTFSHIWDEQYDQCADPEERLGRIADLMKQIANWTPWVRERKMAEAQAIADYNKQLFFSVDWQNNILNELKTNLTTGVQKMNQHKSGKHFYDLREVAKHNPEVAEIVNSDLPWRTQKDVELLVQWLKTPT